MSNNIDFVIENGVLKEYIGTDAVVRIPDGVREIGEDAFEECTNLTTVNIPDGVTEIGTSAFLGCENLAAINILDSVIEIGESAFRGCTRLADDQGFVIVHDRLYDYVGNDETVTIPDGITKIGRFAFYECIDLASITIPGSVTEIGMGAFWGCPKLTIHAPSGSYAEQYARENEIRFEAVAK